MPVVKPGRRLGNVGITNMTRKEIRFAKKKSLWRPFENFGDNKIHECAAEAARTHPLKRRVDYMQLYDKDLLSMQEVRELVEAAKEAPKELATCPSPRWTHCPRHCRRRCTQRPAPGRRWLIEDTGFGKSRIRSSRTSSAAAGVYEYVKDMKTIGELERDEDKGIRTIAVPVGVIAGLIPPPTPPLPRCIRRRSPSRPATPSCSPPSHGPARHPRGREGDPSGHRRGGRQ